MDVLDSASPGELTTAEAKALMRQLAEPEKPVLIFSGGEPLLRPDIFDLALFAGEIGLPAALATNGTLVTPGIARNLKDRNINIASVSLDGVEAATHDRVRGKGSFAKALEGFRNLRGAGIKVQINFTVTKKNAGEVPALYRLACSEHAYSLHLFVLVPVGCGAQIAGEDMLSAEELEDLLRWIKGRDIPGDMPLRAVCAPHYFRISGDGTQHVRKGCLAGIHMCFVSHKGEVFPCGYLPFSAGNIRAQSFAAIWRDSAVFKELRNSDNLTGRCGICEYKDVCGGCRARAYYAHSDIKAEEPCCAYNSP